MSSPRRASRSPTRWRALATTKKTRGFPSRNTPSPAKTPEVPKKAATPEAAPVVQQAPPSAPTKSKTPVRIARRGVGGDELAIDRNDDKPRKKPPSALARRQGGWRAVLAAAGNRAASIKRGANESEAASAPDFS